MAKAPTKHREFAKRLNRYMIERGLNQSDLARKAAQHTPKKILGRSLISKYLKGEVAPTPLYLHAIAKALNVEPEQLLPERSHPVQLPMEDTPEIALKALDGDTAMLRINQRVPMDAALRIMEILREAKK